MITLFRARSSPSADRVQERLEELVVAHRVVVKGAGGEQMPPRLPAIRHGEHLVCGQAELEQYLSELERLMADWNRFQSDSCYLDDEGSVC